METIGLILSCLIALFLILYLTSRKKRTQLQNIFIVNVVLVFCCSFLLLIQKHLSAIFGIDPIWFEKLIYIPTCFLPVSILFTGIIFANTKIKFKRKYILIFIIPILSIIMLWTNEFHHLVYIEYSTNFYENVFGAYYYVHNAYTLLLYFLRTTLFDKIFYKKLGHIFKASYFICYCSTFADFS